jgi:hypothetical protein
MPLIFPTTVTHRPYEDGTYAGHTCLRAVAPVTTEDKLIDSMDYQKGSMVSIHSDQENADYDAGFRAGECGDELDDRKSFAWKIGWAEANE